MFIEASRKKRQEMKITVRHGNSERAPMNIQNKARIISLRQNVVLHSRGDSHDEDLIVFVLES